MNRAWLLGLLAVVVVSPLIVVVLIVSAILLSPLAIMLSTACTCVIACLVFTGVLWVTSPPFAPNDSRITALACSLGVLLWHWEIGKVRVPHVQARYVVIADVQAVG